jgi:guanylate kinase
MDREFRKIRKGLLYVVSAPSGAGKTSLRKEVTRRIPNLEHSISYTTRKARPDEVNGVDYHFVSLEVFNQMIRNNEFAEYAVVHECLYGTGLKATEEKLAKGINLILDIDVQGAAQLRQKYRDGVFIFVLPPSLSTLKKRLSERQSDSTEEIERRLVRGYEEIKHYKKYQYVIVNDHFESAVEELSAIIFAEQCRASNVIVDPEFE